MNTYEQKIETKRERYQELAEKAQTESNDAYKQHKKIANLIPFGQPILVGHHSERGHRSALKKINNLMGKSIELQDKAEYYERKAEGYGKHGISSDDPEALTKLKEKLAKQQEEHKAMIDHNKKARKTGGEICPAYMLSNSNGRMKATKQRIKQLEAKATRQPIEPIKGSGWTLTESLEENRFMFTFDSIPEPETRKILKGRGFKWSPTRNAWVRMITANGRYATKQIIKELT